MNQKEVVIKMQEIARQLRRGIISIGEAEYSMDRVIDRYIEDHPAQTAEQFNEQIANVKKLKRKMWRILLDATK